MGNVKERNVEAIVDKAFENSFKNFDQKMIRDLHPDIFKDEHAWIHVKNALKINNEMIKNALKESLCDLLSDD